MSDPPPSGYFGNDLTHRAYAKRTTISKPQEIAETFQLNLPHNFGTPVPWCQESSLHFFELPAPNAAFTNHRFPTLSLYKYSMFSKALAQHINDEHVFDVIQEVSMYYIGKIGRLQFIGRDDINPLSN